MTFKLDLKGGRKEGKGYILSIDYLPDTSDTLSHCCLHFRDGETEAGQLKSLARMPYGQLQTPLCTFCPMYNLPSKGKAAFFRWKRKRIIATVRVS